jgi:hypothetical protein
LDLGVHDEIVERTYYGHRHSEFPVNRQMKGEFILEHEYHNAISRACTHHLEQIHELVDRHTHVGSYGLAAARGIFIEPVGGSGLAISIIIYH